MPLHIEGEGRQDQSTCIARLVLHTRSWVGSGRWWCDSSAGIASLTTLGTNFAGIGATDTRNRRKENQAILRRCSCRALTLPNPLDLPHEFSCFGRRKPFTDLRAGRYCRREARFRWRHLSFGVVVVAYSMVVVGWVVLTVPCRSFAPSGLLA